MNDPTKRMVDFNIINENALQVQYQFDEEFVPDSLMTNVVVASFTTCWARLKLYEVLDFLGNRVLYYDTGIYILIFLWC